MSWTRARRSACRRTRRSRRVRRGPRAAAAAGAGARAVTARPSPAVFPAPRLLLQLMTIALFMRAHLGLNQVFPVSPIRVRCHYSVAPQTRYAACAAAPRATVRADGAPPPPTPAAPHRQPAGSGRTVSRPQHSRLHSHSTPLARAAGSSRGAHKQAGSARRATLVGREMVKRARGGKGHPVGRVRAAQCAAGVKWQLSTDEQRCTSARVPGLTGNATPPPRDTRQSHGRSSAWRVGLRGPLSPPT